MTSTRRHSDDWEQPLEIPVYKHFTPNAEKVRICSCY